MTCIIAMHGCAKQGGGALLPESCALKPRNARSMHRNSIELITHAEELSTKLFGRLTRVDDVRPGCRDRILPAAISRVVLSLFGGALRR